MAINRDVILRDGYERAVHAGIEPYLTTEEIISIYKVKIIAYGRDCGYTFTEEEVTAYIKKQQENLDNMQNKNVAPVSLRFQK